MQRRFIRDIHTRLLSTLLLAFAIILAIATHAEADSNNRCAQLLSRELYHREFSELAALHIDRKEIDSAILSRKIDADFNRLATELKGILGKDALKKRLSAAIARETQLRSKIKDRLEQKKSEEEDAFFGSVRFSQPQIFESSLARERDGSFNISPTSSSKRYVVFDGKGNSRILNLQEPPDITIQQLNKAPGHDFALGEIDPSANPVIKVVLEESGKRFLLPTAAVNSIPVGISPNGRYVVSFDEKGWIHRLDRKQGQIEKLQHLQSKNSQSEISEEEGWVGLQVRDDGSLTAWQRDGSWMEFKSDLTKSSSGSLQESFNLSLESLDSVERSPDEKQLVIFTQNGRLLVLDSQSGKVQHDSNVGSNHAMKTTWLKDMVVVSNQGRYGRIKAVRLGGFPRIYHGSEGWNQTQGSPYAVKVVNADGKTILIVMDLRNERTLEVPIDTLGAQAYSSAVDISADGRRALISSQTDHEFRMVVLDLETRTIAGETTIEKNGRAYHVPKLSPDGRFVGAGSWVGGGGHDEKAYIWRLDEKSAIQQ